MDENNVCVGYAFCQLQEQPFSNNMVPFKTLFIDDLCVDQEARGRHIGESLFEYVKGEAKRLGCYEVTLNVWAGNTSAEKFYEKMGLKTIASWMKSSQTDISLAGYTGHTLSVCVLHSSYDKPCDTLPDGQK